MTDYEKICDFQNLYKAHKTARKGKQSNTEVIDFEMNLSSRLSQLSESLKNKTYKLSGYYSFTIHEPKVRQIHALHYADRVVQHCICDEVIAPILDKKLIYDNAACRIGKGTHFALNRVSKFLRDFYSKKGTEGYFLKCDIRKFFDSIDHEILKQKLKKVIKDTDVLKLLIYIIDSYETSPGKGIPLGNQTSQWFALYYLDDMDRMVKEKLQIKYYSRYMDDCVLIHENKKYLQKCKEIMQTYLNEELFLDFNSKTQIFPLSAGVNYLGFHTYITPSGKVVRKVSQQTKNKYKRRLKYMKEAYRQGELTGSEIKQVISSYHAHLMHGHTYKLRKKMMSQFMIRKEEQIIPSNLT